MAKIREYQTEPLADQFTYRTESICRLCFFTEMTDEIFPDRNFAVALKRKIPTHLNNTKAEA